MFSLSTAMFLKKMMPQWALYSLRLSGCSNFSVNCIQQNTKLGLESLETSPLKIMSILLATGFHFCILEQHIYPLVVWLSSYICMTPSNFLIQIAMDGHIMIRADTPLIGIKSFVCAPQKPYIVYNCAAGGRS